MKNVPTNFRTHRGLGKLRNGVLGIFDAIAENLSAFILESLSKPRLFVAS
jgi:hypothetical protein